MTTTSNLLLIPTVSMTLVLSQVFSKKMHRWLCAYFSLRKDGWQRILGRKWISTLSSSEKAGKIIGLFTNANETKFVVWWMNVKQTSWWSPQENAPDLSWSREVLNNHALKKYIFYKQQKILGPPHFPYYVHQRQHVWRKYNELWWQDWLID